MKRKLLVWATAAFALSLFFFNFSNVPGKDKKDICLSNIEVLQSSATEIWCDATNNKTCEIGSAKATGFLWAKE